MALPAGVGKKEAAASERRVPLASLFPLESKAEARPAVAGKKMKASTAEAGARPAGAGKKRKASTADARPAGTGKKMEEATAEKKMKEEAVASESGDAALKKEEQKVDSLFLEGEMLKLREELWDAESLWSEKHVPGALDRWLKRKATQVSAVDEKKKKKKVVREILPNVYIERMISNPNLMTELSDEEMAKCHKEDRQTYGITKVINAKDRVYQQALIDQYRAFGFAYDEKEVTEDEEAVKN